MALFQRAATGSQERQDVFVLGDRAGILHHLDQPAIIPHVAESENRKFSFEVLLRFNSSFCLTFDWYLAYVAPLTCALVQCRRQFAVHSCPSCCALNGSYAQMLPDMWLSC